MVSWNLYDLSEPRTIFSDFNELTDIEGIQIDEDKENINVDGFDIIRQIKCTYYIENAKFRISAYLFDDSSHALEFYNLRYNTDLKENIALNIIGILSNSEYCVLKNNKILIVENTSHQLILHKMVKILNDNFTEKV